MGLIKTLTVAAALALVVVSGEAAVQQMADPVEKNGMTIVPLYIQPILMEGGGMVDHSQHGQPPVEKKDGEAARAGFDMHLEVKVHAAAKNPHGFPEGAWIPYLTIKYEVSKYGTDWRGQGELVAMAANDGPHYGGNVKLNGPGRYMLKAVITPPHIPIHVDKETGVGGWWEPFTQEWDFSFFGAGKKGGY